MTAPFIIKVHDVKATGATVRQADVWFVVHGDLKGIDPAHEAARTSQKAVEVANMWFETRILKPEEIRAAGVKAADTSSGKSWYAHIHAKLLDRIDFETTNHVVGSQSSESIVIASATDASFSNAGTLSNGWQPLNKTSGHKPTPRRSSPTPGESATPRSVVWLSIEVLSSSRCTLRSSSRMDGSKAHRFCGQNSA